MQYNFNSIIRYLAYTYFFKNNKILKTYSFLKTLTFDVENTINMYKGN